MKRLRISIWGLRVLVVIVAIDLAAWRTFAEETMARHSYSGRSLLIVGLLPMASLQIFIAANAIPRLRRGEAPGPFALGFSFAGWASLLALMVAESWIGREAFQSFLADACTPIFGAVGRALDLRVPESIDEERVVVIVLITLYSLVLCLPQLFLAMIGGWINNRLRITLRFERRPSPGAAPPAKSTPGATDPVDPLAPVTSPGGGRCGGG